MSFWDDLGAAISGLIAATHLPPADTTKLSAAIGNLKSLAAEAPASEVRHHRHERNEEV